MEEIEVKILEVKPRSIIHKLEDWGAEKVFDGEIVAAYFDFESGRLGKKGKSLRLRQKGENAVELTVKRKISNKTMKIVEEQEVRVDSFKHMCKLLQELELAEWRRITKRRISYLLGDVHFELDTLPAIPTYLEIEAPTVDLVRESVEKLGFTMKDTKPWSTKDVLDYYGKKRT